MPAVRLERRLVPKVWGRRDLPACFGPLPAGGEPVGEAWFPDASGAEADLLVKYLFTSEKLSVQVHPDAAAARAAGHERGKDEAWVVVAADPGATIGLGLVAPVSKEELRAAARDGGVERMLDWRPAKAGDILYSRAGTIHALGPGLVVVEIQQNLDLTYRLYDYGRRRDLHVEEGVAVADPNPYRWSYAPETVREGREILVAGSSFMLERWRSGDALIGADCDAPIWIIPLADGAMLDGDPLDAGSVWIARGPTRLKLAAGAELLLAYAGAKARPAA